MYTPNLVDSMRTPLEIYRSDYQNLNNLNPEMAKKYKNNLLLMLGWKQAEHINNDTAEHIIKYAALDHPRRFGKDIRYTMHDALMFAKTS